MVVLQGVAVLSLWALWQAAVEVRDNVRRYNESIPIMQRDIKELKDNAITKKQLDDAEARVRNDFIKQLEKQHPIMTGNDHGQNYEK